jgi:DNA invertase Pin-like site-specific DNA recombinase
MTANTKLKILNAAWAVGRRIVNLIMSECGAIPMTNGTRDERVYGYGRASTKKQEASPEVQEEKIKEYVRFFHLPSDVAFFMDAATSGKIPIEDREAGHQLFKHLRPGDHVVIAKLDRAFRNLKDCVIILERFENMGIKLHVVSMMGGALDLSSAMGKCVIHVLACFAELERAFISERTKDGLQHRKKKNVRYCNFPGYGFKWEMRRVDGKNVKVKVSDDVERNTMRSILGWRMQDSPLSWQEIEEHLKALGVMNKDGKAWSQPRIRRACKVELNLQLGDIGATNEYHQ